MLSAATLIALVLGAHCAVHEALEALPVGWTESSVQLSGNAELQMQVAL